MIFELAKLLSMHEYELRSLLAIILVCISSGLVGSLVVGNRMAFFSDAMAHCAFAGIGLGTLMAAFAGRDIESDEYIIPLVMVGFGTLIGVAIDLIREKTSLANDTVIGVFFAGAIGFGAMILTALGKDRFKNPEVFLFGSPLFVKDSDLILLVVLFVGASALLCWRYNAFLLETFNVSLARSRRIPVRWDQVAFIVLLAMIVNLSITAVGMLLINAMLIVPAACASNLARNMRQFFWYTVLTSVGCGIVGLQLSLRVSIPYGRTPLQFGPSGVIVVCCVVFFFMTILWKDARDYQLNKAS